MCVCVENGENLIVHSLGAQPAEIRSRQGGARENGHSPPRESGKAVAGTACSSGLAGDPRPIERCPTPALLLWG